MDGPGILETAACKPCPARLLLAKEAKEDARPWHRTRTQDGGAKPFGRRTRTRTSGIRLKACRKCRTAEQHAFYEIDPWESPGVLERLLDSLYHLLRVLTS